MTEDASPSNSKTEFWRFYQTNFRLHVIFLVMAAAILLCSFVMTSEGRNIVRVPGVAGHMPETCISRRLYGFDCPGCGLTRSFISMSHGEFQKAFSFNPAGPIVYLFVLIQVPWHAYQMIRIMSLRRPVETLWLYVPLFGMSAVLLLQWLWRLAAGDLF